MGRRGSGVRRMRLGELWVASGLLASAQHDDVRGTVFVATSEPDNPSLLNDMAYATGCAVRPVLALEDDIEALLRRHGILARHERAVELEPADEQVSFQISRDYFAL
ncbi:hypothetical protein JQX13_04895 [Archangium violaceum]|uniref:GspE/PulE/PilB domain-containing protein n=1 Tax=Archangium violaceum TaxID=83451 RepID=UPI00193C2520|nr:hypothetical protein [Archangium violaceum]QRK09479.1 hypothetical protein JQX13_04895 [Archangium violaceum]